MSLVRVSLLTLLWSRLSREFGTTARVPLLAFVSSKMKLGKFVLACKEREGGGEEFVQPTTASGLPPPSVRFQNGSRTKPSRIWTGSEICLRRTERLRGIFEGFLSFSSMI